MAKQTINLGTAPQGTNGDTLRSAMAKINNNTNELYTAVSKTLKNDGTSGGHFSTTGQIIAGRGSGGVALTNNDGYGNANIAFNHVVGVPEQDGTAGRIYTETDRNTGFMGFQVKSNVIEGTAIQLPTLLTLKSTDTVSEVKALGAFYAPSAYTTTTASSPNVFVNSQGKLARSTSSTRFKKNVQDLVMNDAMYEEFKQLVPIFYQSTSEADNPDYWYQSFNADAVGEKHPSLVGWEDTELVQDKETGEYKEVPLEKRRAIGLNLNGIVAVIQSGVLYQANLLEEQGTLIEEQAKQLEAMNQRLEALENA